MVREQTPLEYFREILKDYENGRYDDFYSKYPPEVKEEAEKTYKHVIRTLEEEEDQ